MEKKLFSIRRSKRLAAACLAAATTLSAVLIAMPGGASAANENAESEAIQIAAPLPELEAETPVAVRDEPDATQSGLAAVIARYELHCEVAAVTADDDESAEPRLMGLETADKTAPATDCALSQELQNYAYTVCGEYGVPYELALAVMFVESRFVAGACSGNNYGLMQINRINHSRLKELLGVSDMLDARDNILSGVYMLSELLGKYGDISYCLICYNQGEGGAAKTVASGVTTTYYSDAVMEMYYHYLSQTNG